MTIGRRIALGNVTIITITIGLGVFALQQIIKINRLSDTVVKDCLPGAALSGTFDAWARQEFILLQTQLLDEDKTAKTFYGVELQKYVTKFKANFAKYKSTISQPADRELFEKLAPPTVDGKQPATTRRSKSNPAT